MTAHLIPPAFISSSLFYGDVSTFLLLPLVYHLVFSITNAYNELGKQLLIRGNRKITLTEEGIILRKRAEEILNLVQKTENEIILSDTTIAGNIYIGTGESEGVRLLIKAGMALQKQYPDIHIHTVSGDALDLMVHLDKGLFDFAVLWDPIDLSAYESMRLPYKDTISLLMPADCTLAMKDSITLDDLVGLPLIISRQMLENDAFASFLSQGHSKLNVVATYNLIFNASLMVEEKMGYAIGFDNIIDTTGNRHLSCKPIYPLTYLHMNLVWKKHQIFTKASQLFLQKVQELASIN